MSSVRDIDMETALDTSRQDFAASRNELYFVDASVPGAEALMIGLGEGSRVYALENTSDVFAQIDAALAATDGAVDALHIYAHGREGALLLGGRWVDAATLADSAEILARIGAALAQGADILLYGCNTGASSLGANFVRTLADLTGADVAASDDVTGAGGDWDLESSAGAVETAPKIPGGWDGTLDEAHQRWGILEGTEGAETLTGFVSNDILISNGGADELIGGRGDDAYYVGADANEVTIVENTGEGVDTVFSQATEFDLGAKNADQSIEYVVLQAQQGMIAQSAKGNDQANILVGNELANMLTGGKGNDQLYGYGGNDYLDGGNGNLDAAVQPGQDYANGEADTLVGGLGDDQYIVRNAGDVVVEYAGQGTDHVYSFVDHALAANVENLTLLENGSGKKAWGNNLNNVITGNDQGNTIDGGAGADTMIGGFGADHFVVDNAGDVVYGEPGREKPVGMETPGLNTMESWITVDLHNARQANGERRYQSIDEVRLMGNGRLNVTAYGESSGMTLVGNAGANIITGSNGRWENGVHSGGNDCIAGGAGHDTIYAGEGNDTIVADGGNDQIWTGTGRDVIRITSGAIGANIQVRDFDAAQDCVNESDPSIRGWTRNVVQSRANTIVTWTNPYNSRQRITLTLLNTQAWQVRFGQSEQTAGSFNALEKDADTPWDITASGSNTTITGGNNNDLITNTGSRNSLDGGAGNDSISAKGGDTVLGGTGNDAITINALGGDTATSVDGGADNDWIQINGVKNGSATIAGGDGADTVAFGGNAVDLTFGADGTLTKIVSGAETVSVTSSGVERFVGTSGADSVDASAVTAGADAPVFVSNGGNDSYTGGDGIDEVHLSPLSSGTALSLDGGGDTVSGMDKLLFDKSQAVNIDLKLDGGRVAVDRNTFAVNGQKVSGTSIKGFETYILGDNNDTITASKEALAAITDHAAFYVVAGGGNDVVSIEDTDGTYAVHLDGGAGNDLISVGKLGGGALVTLEGGDGYDTLRVATGEGISWLLDSAGNVSGLNYLQGAQGTPAASMAPTTITGFEALDGSGNAANDFDAEDFTLTGGRSLVLSGGEGHDHFSLGTVETGGAAYLYGGGGDDRFILGRVGRNAVVHVDGGAGQDRLSFENTDQQVRMALNNLGNLAGAVTVAGQKTMVTTAGINQFYGGNGSDFIDARGVRTPQNGTIRLSGGRNSDWGNDTLYAGNAGSFELHAGNGRDSLVGGTGNDFFVLGDNERTDNDGDDTVVTGRGADTVWVGAHADGAHLFITDFQVGVDQVQDSHLFSDGWVRSAPVAMPGYAGRVIEYSKGDTRFYLHFNNITTAALSNSLTAQFPGCAQIPSDSHSLDMSETAGAVLVTGTAAAEEVVASRGGSTIVGGGGSDTLQGNVGNDSLEVMGGTNTVLASGAGGNDVIRVSGAITGGKYELIGNVPDGPQDPAFGDAGSDTIITGDVSGGELSVTIGRSALDVVSIGNVSGSGRVAVQSLGGPDSVTLGHISGGTVTVDTGRPNTLPGSGNDTISIGTVSGGAVTLSGSRNGNDVISIGDVSGGTVTANANNGNNTFYVGALGGTGTVELTSGEGNDTFHIANVTTESLSHLKIMAGNGNDSVIFTGAAANVTIPASNGERGIAGVFGFQGTEAADVIDAAGYTYGVGDHLRIMVHGGGGDDTLIGTTNQLLTGGKGNDLLCVKNLAGNTWVRGGEGTDTLSLADVGTGSFTLQGGAAGSGVAGAPAQTTGVWTQNGTISLEEVEVIRLDASQANSVQLNTRLTATLEFGAKADSLHIADGGAGSVIHIRNWKPGTHNLFAESGWSSTARVVNGSTQYTFTQGRNSVTVWLDGVQDMSASTIGQVFNVHGGQTVLGTKGADTFNVSLGGDAVYVKTNGAPGGKQYRDRVYLTVTGNSEAENMLIATALQGVGSTHGRVHFQGSGVQATFANVTGEDGTEQVALTSLTANGFSATVTAYGFTRWIGTTGADFIDASKVAQIEASEVPTYDGLEYDTEGGSDTYLGGAGQDFVSVYSVNGNINAQTRMSLDGGAGDYDRLWFENAKDARGNSINASVELAIDDKGDAQQVVYNGVDLSESTFTNFENYYIDGANSRVDISRYNATGGKFISVHTGTGSDTITGSGGMNAMASGFFSSGEGNDTFDFRNGTILPAGDMGQGSTPGLQLSGEQGNDTFKFNAAGHTVAVTAFGGDGNDRYEFYGVGPNFKLEDLKFSLSSYNPNGGTLQVWNIDSQNRESNALYFQLGEGQYSGEGWNGDPWNRSLNGDRMGFYNESGTRYLASDVDMQSIVDAIQTANKADGSDVSLTFTEQNGLWKATGVKNS